MVAPSSAALVVVRNVLRLSCVVWRYLSIIALLKTWKSLQAYRATVPMGVLETSAELFCLNVEIALAVLEGDAQNEAPSQ